MDSEKYDKFMEEFLDLLTATFSSPQESTFKINLIKEKDKGDQDKVKLLVKAKVVFSDKSVMKFKFG